MSGKLNIGRGRPPFTISPPISSPMPTSSSQDPPCEAFNRLRITRPSNRADKKGTVGVPVNLRANYFRLEKMPDFQFTLYRVDFKPPVDELNRRKRLVNDLKDVLRGYVFDGANLIYLTHKLNDDEKIYVCRDEEHTKIRLRYTGEELRSTDPKALQIYNLILRRTIGALKLERIGRNMYDSNATIKINEYNVELWPGYITSIRHHEDDQMMVACEISHKVMRKETVLDMIKVLMRENSSTWQDAFKRDIIGRTVMTAYNNKTYKIDDVKFDMNPLSTFENRRGEQKSFKEYFQDRYKLQIREDRQPLLVSKPDKKDVDKEKLILLVPEICQTSGLTDKMRSNFQMMRAMAQHTQLDPESRRKRLTEFVKRIRENGDSKAVMENFSINVDQNLVKVVGRGLEQQTMVFGDKKTFKNTDSVDWTNATKSNQMFLAVSLKRWVLMYPKRAARETKQFIEVLLDVCKGMQYETMPPKFIELADDRIQTYTAELQSVLALDPKLVMVIIPTLAADKYAAVKRATCITNSVPTQVVLGRTITPKPGAGASSLRSVATKIALQLNCKLGGAPWSMEFPAVMKGVMCIGFDIIRDTKNRNQFYGAFIASMDLREKVEFYSACSMHKTQNEMASNITSHVMKAIRAYKANSGCFPAQIIFYREGVGEGDINEIHADEIPKMMKSVDDIYEKYNDGNRVKMMYLVVNKKINTKIFRDGSRMVNPISGTVVDSTITLPERYDFFLVSQSVRQGTVSPTSYNIIHDTSNWGPNDIQSMTYKMCHMYFNWSGTVKVPAVLQYARKLAILTGEHLHAPPSEEFGNKLFFL